jgi:hypothetical protein
MSCHVDDQLQGIPQGLIIWDRSLKARTEAQGSQT